MLSLKGILFMQDKILYHCYNFYLNLFVFFLCSPTSTIFHQSSVPDTSKRYHRGGNS